MLGSACHFIGREEKHGAVEKHPSVFVLPELSILALTLSLRCNTLELCCLHIRWPGFLRKF